jgi:ABC-type transporter Mla maintaining outer membrane lipid asymmetry permease subunit MlaE
MRGVLRISMLVVVLAAALFGGQWVQTSIPSQSDASFMEKLAGAIERIYYERAGVGTLMP